MHPAQLFDRIYTTHQALPEYLFAKSPTCAVFRHQSDDKRGKWFCVFMSVHASKLGLSGNVYHDIINVKARPEFVGSLLRLDGILPAYHMNKEHWVSVLTDVASDDEIIRLIDESFGLTHV